MGNILIHYTFLWNCKISILWNKKICNDNFQVSQLNQIFLQLVSSKSFIGVYQASQKKECKYDYWYFHCD
jgi:hypothetical protein